MAEKPNLYKNSVAGVSYLGVRCPAPLARAVKRLSRLAGCKSGGEYLLPLVREDAINYAYQLSDDEFDQMLAELDNAEEDIRQQRAFNAKHTRRQWHKLEQSGKLGKKTGKEYL